MLELQTLSIEDIAIGDGVEVEEGDIVSIRYVVRLYHDQSLIDSSDQGLLFNVNVATGVFTFIQGTDEAIEGLNIGLLGMKGGGRREISVPYNMAWGRGVDGVVPTRSDILLEVELLKRPSFSVMVPGDGEPVEILKRAAITFDSDFFTTKPPASPEHVPYLFLLGRGHSLQTDTFFPGFPQGLTKIAGLHLLLQDMRVGDTYQVTISPELAFGSQPIEGLLPANSTVEAEISVVAVY